MTPEQLMVGSAGEVAPEAERSARNGKSCQRCGDPVPPGRKDRLYCGDVCRAATGHERHDEKIRQEALLPFSNLIITNSVISGPEAAKDCRHIGATGDEITRTKGQCDRILVRLRQGPATNRELSQIALKYTGRISELRDAGHNVSVVSRDRSNGLTVYVLLEPAQRELADVS